MPRPQYLPGFAPATTERIAGAPLAVCYGAGVDSTAMLVGFRARGIRPDLITFADTGSERPETYAYLPIMQAWLKRVGFPPVTVVRKNCKHGRYDSLEGNCIANRTLPSLAFGRKSCSIKWKREPQDVHRNSWLLARETWAEGRQVVVAIGYDAGPKDSRRHSLVEDEKYSYWYPLREWDWDRERCEVAIMSAGLPVPVKSACFFCPSMKPSELDEMIETHPKLAQRIIDMEDNARLRLTKIKGLWRRGTKGMRGATAKPGRMADWIEARREGIKWTPEANVGIEEDAA